MLRKLAVTNHNFSFEFCKVTFSKKDSMYNPVSLLLLKTQPEIVISSLYACLFEDQSQRCNSFPLIN